MTTRHRNKHEPYRIVYAAKVVLASLRYVQRLLIMWRLSPKARRDVGRAIKSMEGAIRHWSRFTREAA